MTELEKIEYAKSFIDKLSYGINPLDDKPIPENDIVNNVRLSRCFSYVSEVLGRVINNGGVAPIKHTKKKKNQFSLTAEQRANIHISDVCLTVSEMAEHLNSVIDIETTKKISAATINNWLLGLGLLEVVTLSNGQNRKMPTPQGNEIGIFAEERTGQYGTYFTVLHSPQAQEFVYDNIEAIIAFKQDNKGISAGLSGAPWTREQDASLTDLFSRNVPVAEISDVLKRSDSAIRARLKRLGLIEKRSDAD